MSAVLQCPLRMKRATLSSVLVGVCAVACQLIAFTAITSTTAPTGNQHPSLVDPKKGFNV